MSVLLLAVVLMVGVLVCVLLIAFEWARSKKVDDKNAVIGRMTQQGWVSSSKDSAIVDRRKRVS